MIDKSVHKVTDSFKCLTINVVALEGDLRVVEILRGGVCQITTEPITADEALRYYIRPYLSDM